MVKGRTAYYVQYWWSKTGDPTDAQPYYWGDAYNSLREALDAANRCEEKKTGAFNIDIYSQEEKWVPYEEYPTLGKWEGIEGTMVVYNRRGAVVYSDKASPVPHNNPQMFPKTEKKCQFCDRPAKFKTTAVTGETVYLCSVHVKTFRSGRVPVPIEPKMENPDSDDKALYFGQKEKLAVALLRAGQEIRRNGVAPLPEIAAIAAKYGLTEENLLEWLKQQPWCVMTPGGAMCRLA